MNAHITLNEGTGVTTPEGHLLWQALSSVAAPGSDSGGGGGGTTTTTTSASLESSLDAFAELRRTGDLAPGTLLSCLRGSRLRFPGPEKPVVSEEMLARRAFLAGQQVRREYSELTKALQPEERDTVSRLIPDLSIGANMITLGFTCFVVCYVGASSVFESVAERMVAGLCGFIVILFIEMFLFITREAKAEDLRSSKGTVEKQRQKPTQKQKVS